MKVIILGSGVIGVASAYYLAKAGHEVTVVDRQPGPGLETSFANAGEISPGYASPWAGPGIPIKAIKWLVMPDGPLVIRPMLDPRMWLWGLQLLTNFGVEDQPRDAGWNNGEMQIISSGGSGDHEDRHQESRSQPACRPVAG